LIEEAKPVQYAMVPSLLKDAIEEASQIIASLSAGEPGEVERIMRELSPRTIRAIQKMAKVLHDSGAETKIVGDRSDLTLDHGGTSSLCLRLLDVEVAERREKRSGVLLGLFPERQQYEFQPAGGGPIFYGPVSEAFDNRYRSNPDFARSILFQSAIATFVVNSTLRGGTPQTEEWVLEDIQLSLAEPFGAQGLITR
jgi:hypothetical protein